MTFTVCYEDDQYRTAETKAHAARKWAKRRNMPRRARRYKALHWIGALIYFRSKCAYCGQRDDQLTADHFIPLSKGGPSTPGNILPACAACNHAKDDSDPVAWLYATFEAWHADLMLERIHAYFNL